MTVTSAFRMILPSPSGKGCRNRGKASFSMLWATYHENNHCFFLEFHAMSLPGQLNPPARLLLGPGPSDAHPRVLTAMATPLLGHLDPYFLELMLETQEMLRSA